MQKPLFCKEINGGTFDGGHAMIFTDRDGTKYMSMHSPNYTVGDRRETPIFVKIIEEDGIIKLVW